MAEIPIIDDEFEQFALMQHLQAAGQQLPEMYMNARFNFCEDCNRPMEVHAGEFRCECGYRTEYEVDKDFSDVRTAPVRIATGANKGRVFNVHQEYTRVQYRNILDTLKLFARNFEARGNAPFSLDILTSAAQSYNSIQKHVREEVFDADGTVVGEKKFVRRSSIMAEIISAIIWFETIKAGNPRSKENISDLMMLQIAGFARGEDIVRNLAAEGKFELPDESDYNWGYIDRYLESLGLEDERAVIYKQFVIDIVTESDRVRLGMTSQLPSKIAGALWILITKLKLPITAAQLEQAADNTKKNTFTKFSNVVRDNPRVFRPIFTKYSVPF